MMFYLRCYEYLTMDNEQYAWDFIQNFIKITAVFLEALNKYYGFMLWIYREH